MKRKDLEKIAVVLDVRTMCEQPAELAAELAESVAAITAALARSSGKGVDPLAAAIAAAMRRANGEGVPPWARSVLGITPDGAAFTMAGIVRDRCGFNEVSTWRWLILSHPERLEGQSPLAAIRNGKGSAVLQILVDAESLSLE